MFLVFGTVFHRRLTYFLTDNLDQTDEPFAASKISRRYEVSLKLPENCAVHRLLCEECIEVWAVNHQCALTMLVGPL